MNPVLSHKNDTNSPAVRMIIDPLVSQHHLRSISLLNFYCFNQFTYPWSWSVLSGRLLPLVKHSWIHDQEVTSSDSMIENLAIIAISDVERKTRFSISPIINSFLRSEKKSNRLWIVVDNDSFQYRGELRPLIEEPWVIHNSYAELFEKVKLFLERRGLELPLTDSQSPYFQINAYYLSRSLGEKIRNLESFFEHIFEEPNLPVWNDLGELFGYGDRLPTTSISELSRYLSIYVEIDPNSNILGEFFEKLQSEFRYYLDPRCRRNTLNDCNDDRYREFEMIVAETKEELMGNDFTHR